MSIKKLPISEENPFLEPLKNYAIEKFRIVNSTPKKMLDAKITETGQDIKVSQYDTSKSSYLWRDQDGFTKVFKSRETFNILKKLSKNARTMLDYIEFVLGYNETCVELEYKAYIRALLDNPDDEYKAAYYRGIKELCDANILHRKSGTTYHINPFILFNGRREEIIGSVPYEVISDKHEDEHKPYKAFNRINSSK